MKQEGDKALAQQGRSLTWDEIKPLVYRPETALEHGQSILQPAWPFKDAIGTPEAGAYFSKDGKYRYLLWRHWDENNPYKVAFVLLNSSTADHEKNDHTITRCIDFAKAWGYGGAYWMNLFAIRSYDPSVLKTDPDPVGPENDRILREMTHHPLVRMVVLGCGALGNTGGRLDKVLKLLPDNCFCLGMTKAGLPRHPLYLKASTAVVPYIRCWYCTACGTYFPADYRETHQKTCRIDGTGLAPLGFVAPK